jgi:hypothetical protein
MKKKQLKKIKKIIGVLSAIVQEHEGREVRNMQMVLEVENKSSDELRAELAEGKALGKEISATFQKLLNDKNICHLVKDRSNISDQKDRPNFTSIRDRTIWELRNSPSQQ